MLFLKPGKCRPDRDNAFRNGIPRYQRSFVSYDLQGLEDWALTIKEKCEKND